MPVATFSATSPSTTSPKPAISRLFPNAAPACQRGVRDSVRIDLYAAEPVPLGVAGPIVSAGVRRMVEQKGIAYHPEHQVTRVDPAARRSENINRLAPFCPTLHEIRSMADRSATILCNPVPKHSSGPRTPGTGALRAGHPPQCRSDSTVRDTLAPGSTANTLRTLLSTIR